MITLKDIKVSKNRIPVQNALWLRPTGGLTFKIYYPHGGDWSEVMTTDSDMPTPSELEEIEEHLDSIDETIESLTLRLKSVESLKPTVSALDRKVTSVASSAQKGNINAYTALMGGYESIEVPVLLSFSAGENIPSFSLQDYGLTEDILNIINEAEYEAVCIYKNRIEGTEIVKKRVVYRVEIEREDDEWTTITLTEFSIAFGAELEKYTITKTEGFVPSVAGKVNIYNIVRTIVSSSNPTPFNPGGPTGPTGPSTPLNP
jgi:hypothetical protein